VEVARLAQPVGPVEFLESPFADGFEQPEARVATEVGGAIHQ
jgi:hypothetical protein